jgi:hypothetical protein
MATLFGMLPFLQKLFADGGYNALATDLSSCGSPEVRSAREAACWCGLDVSFFCQFRKRTPGPPLFFVNELDAGRSQSTADRQVV